ncbi:SRPBCC domain-containing protein [Phenylobacterium sp.]|uniref:SRPBCC family protein n=1 Tax=Phenylobacterium sp. TaxID=1871053 RepID=UPI00301DB42A
MRLSRRRLAAAAALTMLFAGPAAAQSVKDFPDVTDSSFAEPNGSRVLRLSAVIPAERAKVWQAFATAEGWRAWATPLAAVDLRVGGVIETSYDTRAQIGNPENIKNQITAYVPERLLVFRNIQAPSGLPGRERFGETAAIVELEDAGAGQTRVTLTGVGYAPGEPFDTLYRHFAWGNAYSLMKLKESFMKGPIDWKQVEAQRQAGAAAAKVAGQDKDKGED